MHTAGARHQTPDTRGAYHERLQEGQVEGEGCLRNLLNQVGEFDGSIVVTPASYLFCLEGH